jgi:hypothetical protein
MRVACQVLHIDKVPDGTLIDLIALESSDWHGRSVLAGTPFTLGFSAIQEDAQHDLDAMMRAWEQTCAVLDVVVDEQPEGLRYEFSSGHHQLVVNVDDAPDLGI